MAVAGVEVFKRGVRTAGCGIGSLERAVGVGKCREPGLVERRRLIGIGTPRPAAVQAERLGTVVVIAAGRLVVNARVDTYVSGDGDDDDAIARATAYLAAGADCAYPIGRLDDATTARLAEAIPGPVNVLAYPCGPTVERLGALGVARLTFGSGLFKEAMATVTARAEGLAP